MKPPRIQVLLDQAELTPEVSRALRQIGAEIELSNFARPARAQRDTPVDARLIVSADAASLRTTSARFDQLTSCFDADPCATLVLSTRPLTPGNEAERAVGHRAIGFAAALSRDELAGRLAAMCGLRPSLHALHRELRSLRRCHAQQVDDLRRLSDERRLAGMIQRDLLPNRIPNIRNAAVHTLFQPADEVSGDLFDIVRLDHNHVALFLVDATGHGLAAALLAAFVKRALRALSFEGRAPLIASPDDVLCKLNEELLHAELTECHFVAATYAIYHERTREIHWARGGGSYPIVIRDGRAQQILSAGPIVGADAGAGFEVVRMRLAPGETILFHTDGLDAMLVHNGHQAAAADIEHTDWFRSLGDRDIPTELQALEAAHEQFVLGNTRGDDLTVIALEARPSLTPHEPVPALAPVESFTPALAGVYL